MVTKCPFRQGLGCFRLPAVLTAAGGRAICAILTSRPGLSGLGEYPMRLFARFRGRAASPLCPCCAPAWSWPGCTGDEDLTATGSPFTQALFRDYTDLATQAAAAPAPPATESDGGFFSDLANVFDSGPANPADAVADAFRAKAEPRRRRRGARARTRTRRCDLARPARPPGARHRAGQGRVSRSGRPRPGRLSIAGCWIAAPSI